MFQMSLFEQVNLAIKAGRPFTLYPFFIGEYQPEGRSMHILEYGDVGQLGYILQWWARLAIYGNKKLSFNPIPQGVEIIYKYEESKSSPDQGKNDTTGTSTTGK